MLDEKHGLALWHSSPIIQTNVTTLAETNVRDSNRVTISDKVVGHVYGSDTSALPPLGRDLESYEHWSSVASTIYRKLYQIAQFDPSTLEYSETVFARLQNSFSTNPFWNSQFVATSRDVAIRPRNYKLTIYAIEDFLSGIEIAPAIQKLIIGNVKRVAQLASEPNGWPEKQSVLYNATIAISEGNLNIISLYTTVHFEIDQQKGRYQTSNQNIKMFLHRGVLDFDFCKRHASNIRSYGRQSVSEWEEQAAANSQPENTSEGWL